MPETRETYEEYLRDFDPSPQEPWEGYSSPLDRDDWEELQDRESQDSGAQS